MAHKISHEDAIRIGIASESGDALKHTATLADMEEAHDDSLTEQYWSIDDDGHSVWVQSDN